MRISDWSSDVCSSDLAGTDLVVIDGAAVARDVAYEAARQADFILIPTKTAVFDTMSMTHTLDVVRQLDRAFAVVLTFVPPQGQETRSEEHTSELQSLLRISYAVFCLHKNRTPHVNHTDPTSNLLTR